LLPKISICELRRKLIHKICSSSPAVEEDNHSAEAEASTEKAEEEVEEPVVTDAPGVNFMTLQNFFILKVYSKNIFNNLSYIWVQSS
jgi:hypothetical protein